MQQIKLSESTAARRRIPVVLVDATDGYSEVPGLTPSSTLVSKNGGTEGSGSGTWAEVGHGHYYYELTATEVNTVGYVEVRIVATGARTFYAVAQVVAFDPYDATALGLSRVDVALSTLATAAALTAAGGDVTTLLGRLTSTRGGYIDNLSGGAVALASALVTAQTDLTTLTGRLTSLRAAGLDNLDAAITSRASAANMTTALSGLVAINADTDDLQTRAADIQAHLPALVGGRIDASVGAMASGVLTATAIAADAITAAKLAADVSAEIAAAVAAPSAATIASTVDTTLSGTHGSGAWGGSGGATAGEIADAVLDEVVSGHAGAGSVGAALSSLLSGQTSIASAVAAMPSASAIASAVLGATLEGAHTVADGVRLLLAVALGRRAVSGTTHTYRNLANDKNRVVATVDSSGNRSTATADGT